MQRVLPEAPLASVHSCARLRRAATGVVEAEAELATIWGMRGSGALRFPLGIATIAGLLLLLGELPFSRVAIGACTAVP